jgi:hypothetical protein
MMRYLTLRRLSPLFFILQIGYRRRMMMCSRRHLHKFNSKDEEFTRESNALVDVLPVL